MLGPGYAKEVDVLVQGFEKELKIQVKRRKGDLPLWLGLVPEVDMSIIRKDGSRQVKDYFVVMTLEKLLEYLV
jgi:hypothetical protein